MLTLYELKELLGEEVISHVETTPRWRVLRDSGAGIITDVAVDKDTLLEVYDNGFVLYETELHHTVFPLRDALSDYTYESVTSGNKESRLIPLTDFYDMPWVFRVLMEAEDRVVHNLYTSPAVEGIVSLSGVMLQLIQVVDGSQDILDVIIQSELKAALKESERALTDYQKHIINAIYHDERSMKDVTNEVETSRRAVEDVIERALINMRKMFRDMGYEIESSLLKHK